MNPTPILPNPATHYLTLWSQAEDKIAALLNATHQHQAADPHILNKASKALRSIHAAKRRLVRIIKHETRSSNPKTQNSSQTSTKQAATA